MSKFNTVKLITLAAVLSAVSLPAICETNSLDSSFLSLTGALVDGKIIYSDTSTDSSTQQTQAQMAGTRVIDQTLMVTETNAAIDDTFSQLKADTSASFSQTNNNVANVKSSLNTTNSKLVNNKIGSVNGYCSPNGGVGRTSAGDPISCKSSRWKSASGALPTYLDTRVKKTGYYTENGFNASYSNCRFYANGDGTLRKGGYSGAVVGNVIAGAFYGNWSDECTFYPNGGVSYYDSFEG